MPNSTAERTRPLSPNIQIYRPQLTSVLSIANRMTGVVLSVCAVVPFAATILPLIGLGFLADKRVEHVVLAVLKHCPTSTRTNGAGDGHVHVVDGCERCPVAAGTPSDPK